MAVLFLALPPGARAQALSDVYDCVIEPYEVVELGSSANGVLAEVPVERGDRVKAGQLVARIESSVEKAAVELARVRADSDAAVDSRLARLKFQRARLERNRKLHEKNAISKGELEEIQTEVELAELDLRQARVDQRMAELELQRATGILERRKVYSPVDGVVMQRELSVGEFVHEQSTVMTIARLDPLYVEAYLPAAIYEEVRVGMQARVQPKEAVKGSFDAVVSVRDRVLDPASGTFGVRLKLDNPDYRLPAGIKCRLSLGIEKTP